MVAFSQLMNWAAVAGLLGAIGCSAPDLESGGNSQSPVAIGDAASVRLLDLDGRPFGLWNVGPERIRVVVFTRSDCPVSNRYAPEVKELYESFHPRGVDFYLIYVDPNETAESIRSHVAEFGYPCPAFHDPRHTLVAYTRATVTPEAVIFDRDGQITYRGRVSDLYAGLGKARSAATKHDLRDAIEATLNGQPVAEPVTKAIGCFISDLK
jgi:hypothetical protein